MDFKTTFTRTRSDAQDRRRGGFTIIELMFTLGITTLALATLMSFFVFSTHGFATLFNYVDLDDANRIAMDQLTRDIRQASYVISYTSNTLVLQTTANLSLTYDYSPTDRTLTRTLQGDSPTVILQQCDRLSFVIGQRNPVNGTYDVYPAATAATAKVVNVSWMCSRTIFGFKEDTESVQTARIVIRKQGS
jgi:Tfp pilus assembly protein PilW